MSRQPSEVSDLAFDTNWNLMPATWAVTGVELVDADTSRISINAFACARVVDRVRTYPRLVRLSLFTDEEVVKDFVWNSPNGSVNTYIVDRVIPDFGDYFRGEPQPLGGYIDAYGGKFIRGIYRSICTGRSVEISGDLDLKVARQLPPEQLGTPPTYVHDERYM